jgi:hypothetical protein
MTETSYYCAVMSDGQIAADSLTDDEYQTVLPLLNKSGLPTKIGLTRPGAFTDRPRWWWYPRKYLFNCWKYITKYPHGLEIPKCWVFFLIAIFLFCSIALCQNVSLHQDRDHTAAAAGLFSLLKFVYGIIQPYLPKLIEII